MNPARTLDQVLKSGEARSFRRTDVPLMRWSMIAVTVLGIGASFIGVTLHLERVMNREARMRVELIGAGFSARLDEMLANVGRHADEALPFVARILAEDSADNRREALQKIGRLFIGSSVAGGVVANASGDFVATFGAAGPAASEAHSRLPGLSKSGNVEMPGFDGAALFRVAGSAEDEFIILHLPLTTEAGRASLLLAVPSKTVRAAALRIAPEGWHGSIVLIDDAGAMISFLAGDTALGSVESVSGKPQATGAAAGVFSGMDEIPVYAFKVAKPGRGLSIAVFEPRMTLLSIARSSAIPIGLSVCAGIAGILLLGFLVRNEWRRRDETLQEFTRFTRMLQRALPLLGVHAVYWRPQEHEARFSPGWPCMLGLNRKDVGRGFDILTRHLHPDDRKAALEGYQALARGEIDRLSRIIRLRGVDGAFISIEEKAGVANPETAKGGNGARDIVILHRTLQERRTS